MTLIPFTTFFLQQPLQELLVATPGPPTPPTARDFKSRHPQLVVVHAFLRSSENPSPEGGEEAGRRLKPSLVIVVFSKSRCHYRSLIAAPKLLAVDSTTSSPEWKNQCNRRGKTSMENR